MRLVQAFRGVGCPQRLFYALVVWGLLSSVLILGLCLPASAANDLIADKAWLEDPSGNLGFPQVIDNPNFQPYEGLLSRGYGEGVLWLRLTIQPSRAKNPDGGAIMRILPAYLDEVVIFDSRVGDDPVEVLGNRHHPQEAELLSQAFDYPVVLSSEPFELYLRVSSTSTRQVLVQVLTPSVFQRTSFFTELTGVFYVVALWVVLLTSLVQWRLSQDSLFGYFSMAMLTAFAYGWSVTGLIRVIWPLGWPVAWMDAYQSFFALAATAAGILFHLMFLRKMGLPRWGHLCGVVLMAHQVVQFVLLFLGLEIQALALNFFDVLIAPVLMLVLALVSGEKGERKDLVPHWVVVSLYSVLLAFLLFAVLPGLGWVKGPEFSLYIVQANVILTALLVLLVLQYRQRLINQQRLAFQEKVTASEQAAERARFARAEQQKLVNMLTHELKVPLAVMRLQIDESDPVRAPLSRAIQDMTSIIERCGEAAKAEEGHLLPHIEPVDLCALIGEVIDSVVDGHKVDWQRPAAPFMVQTDSQLLFVVLINLIENACKYSPKDATVSVWLATSENANSWSMSVANPPGAAGWPDPNQLFAKYYRASQARRQSGTGLGLFLAQSLAGVLDLDIKYTPEPGRVVFQLSPLV